MKENKPELLLPAKNLENLKAAVNNGADAVYLGMKRFNARISAGNFDSKELKKGVEYAHEHGVKIYITLNTLIKNKELDLFFKEVTKAYNFGADAVIIQDLAIAEIIKREFPGLEVHLSTQARIGNLEAIKKVDYVDRIILPRELTETELKELTKTSPLPLEMFVHGALCFSLSGVCLMSSMIGRRSGNRGMCAQPCRKRYNGKYILSMKDLCLVKELESIKKLGIVSIKIEGRMRSPFYVSTTARIYRKAIDGDEITPNDLLDLELAFNRDFTTGFFKEDKNKISFINPRNRGLFLGIVKDKKIKLNADIKVGDGISIWRGIHIWGQRIEKIIWDQQELPYGKKDSIVDLGMNGLEDGDKIYKTSYEYNGDYDIQKLKRLSKARGRIVSKRKEIKGINLNQYTDGCKNSNLESKRDLAKLYVRVNNLEENNLQGVKDTYNNKHVKAIIYNIDQKDILKFKTLTKEKFYVELPIVIKDSEYDHYLKKINELKPEGVITRNLAFLNCHPNTLSGYQLNMFNDLNRVFLGKGIVSPELNLSELKNMKNKDFLVLIHGAIVVMTTKNKLPSKLVDDLGEVFKVEKEREYYKVYNSKEIGLFDEINNLLDEGINQFYLELNGKIGKWVDIYSKIIEGKNINLDKIKKGFTTGHLNRGV